MATGEAASLRSSNVLRPRRGLAPLRAAGRRARSSRLHLVAQHVLGESENDRARAAPPSAPCNQVCWMSMRRSVSLGVGVGSALGVPGFFGSNVCARVGTPLPVVAQPHLCVLDVHFIDRDHRRHAAVRDRIPDQRRKACTRPGVLEPHDRATTGIVDAPARAYRLAHVLERRPLVEVGHERTEVWPLRMIEPDGKTVRARRCRAGGAGRCDADRARAVEARTWVRPDLAADAVCAGRPGRPVAG